MDNNTGLEQLVPAILIVFPCHENQTRRNSKLLGLYCPQLHLSYT